MKSFIQIIVFLMFVSAGLSGCGKNFSDNSETGKLAKTSDQEIQLNYSISPIPDYENPMRPYQLRSVKSKSLLGYGVMDSFKGERDQVSQKKCYTQETQVLETNSTYQAKGGGENFVELYNSAQPFPMLLIKDRSDSLISETVLNYATRSYSPKNSNSIAKYYSVAKTVAALSFIPEIPKRVIPKDECNTRWINFERYFSTIYYGCLLNVTPKLVFDSASSIEKFKDRAGQTPIEAVFESNKIQASTVTSLLTEFGLKDMRLSVVQLCGDIKRNYEIIEAAKCSKNNIEACRKVIDDLINNFEKQMPKSVKSEKDLEELEPIGFETQYGGGI